jgi:HEAT repeat protein
MGQVQTHEAIAALTTAARDSNLWVRYFALRALGQAGEAAHADALACLAECATRDDAPPVRIAAIDSLAAIGSPTMGIVVRPIVLDQNVEVATAAVAALGSFDAEESERELRFAIDGSEPRLVREALDTIGRLRAGYMVPFLSSLIRESSDDEVRRQAVRTLGQIGQPAAVEALLALAGDRRLRDAVIAAIATLDAEQTAGLREYLSKADEPHRRIIVNAVSRNKTESAAGILALALDDESPRIRLAAARALGRIDLRDARAQLAVVARSDADLTVRRAAEDALSR